MGQRAAKDASEKRGHDRRAEAEPRLAGHAAEWARPRASWPAPVKRWYGGLVASGQAVYYQQSDADQAYILAEVLAAGLRTHDGALIRIWLTGARELLTTESARRAAHVRLEPATPQNREAEAEHAKVLHLVMSEFGEPVGAS